MRILYFLFIQIVMTYCVVAQSVHYNPPENFIADPDASVQTWVNETSAAVVQITTGENVDMTKFYNEFNQEQLIENGLEVLSEDVHIVDDNVQNFYFKCRYSVPQEHEGQVSEFIRLVYFTQVSGQLVMAVASFPEITSEILQDPVLESFKSIQ